MCLTRCSRPRFGVTVTRKELSSEGVGTGGELKVVIIAAGEFSSSRDLEPTSTASLSISDTLIPTLAYMWTDADRSNLFQSTTWQTERYPTPCSSDAYR